MIGTVAERWRAFWFAPMDPRPVAALRIAFGLLALLHLAGTFDIGAYWAPDGIITPGAHAGISSWLLSHGLGRWFGMAFLSACLLAAVLMTVGLASTPSVWIAFVLANAEARWNGLPLSAATQVWLNAVFCLAWTRSGAVWSVDAWRGRASAPARVQPWWPMRLLQFEVLIIYFVAGAWKLLDPRWRNGSALHYILSGTSYTRFPLAPAPAFDTLLVVFSYATIVWELSMPALLAWRRTRRFALASGVIAHLTMGAVLEVGLFTPAILAAYLAFWKPAAGPVSQ